MKITKHATHIIASMVVLIVTLCINACKEDSIMSEDIAPKPTHKQLQTIPVGMKPYAMGMSKADVSVGEMLAHTAMDGNKKNQMGTRAISAKEENSEVKFRFTEKESRNMLLILRKDNKVAYFRNICYKGKPDGKLFIKQQPLDGFATQNMPATVRKGEKGWYAMLIYDNPKKIETDPDGSKKYGLAYAEGRDFKMKVGMMYDKGNGKNVLSSIGYHKESDNLLSDEVEIPFVSNWVPVSVTDDNELQLGYAKMKPQGVLMRIDIKNTSKFNCRVKQVTFETNMLHGNIEYNLSPEKLPKVNDNNANAHLQFTGINGEEGGGHLSNTDNLVMMGKSFVGSIAYELDKDRLYSVIGKEGGHLSYYYYVWGMPKTNEELRQIKAEGNIPMTAVYVFPEVVKESRFMDNIVISNEPDFNDLMLKGVKPAPLLTYDLYMASRFLMRNKDKTICNGENGGLVPVNIDIKTRAPLPIEYLCQYHAIKPTFDDRPNFSTTNDIVRCIENGEIIVKSKLHKEGLHGACYFSYEDITPKQPDGTENWDMFRLKNSHGLPVPGYHIPSTAEIRSIFPYNNVLMSHAGNGAWGVPPLKNNVWVDEYMKVTEGKQNVNTIAKYFLVEKETDLKRFLAITNNNKDSNDQLIGIRGLKKVGDNRFEYTSALGIYIYSPGYNQTYVGCLPLSRYWVTRFNGNIDKFYEYVSSNEFFIKFSKTKIDRMIAPISNYNRLTPGEPRYGFSWLSQGSNTNFKNSGAIVWGVAKEDAEGVNKKNYDFRKGVLFSEIYNQARCVNNKNLNFMSYGVHLFKDELW